MIDWSLYADDLVLGVANVQEAFEVYRVNKRVMYDEDLT